MLFWGTRGRTPEASRQGTGSWLLKQGTSGEGRPATLGILGGQGLQGLGGEQGSREQAPSLPRQTLLQGCQGATHLVYLPPPGHSPCWLALTANLTSGIDRQPNRWQ